MLDSYRVLEKIGEGGMGEVYQARDTKIDRDVAIKVLPEAFTADPVTEELLAIEFTERNAPSHRMGPGLSTSRTHRAGWRCTFDRSPTRIPVRS